MDMYDPNGQSFDTQLIELARQQKLAEALRTASDKAKQNTSPGQMVGKYFVPASGLESLSNLVGQLKAQSAESDVTNQQKSLNQAMQQHAQEWRSSLPQAIAAQKGMPPNLVMESPEGQAGTPDIPAQPVTLEQVLKKTMAAGGNPLLKNDAATYEKYMAAQIDREDKQAQATALLDQQQVLGREKLKQEGDLRTQALAQTNLLQQQAQELRKQGLQQSGAYQTVMAQIAQQNADTRRAAVDTKSDKSGDKLAADQERAGERLSTKASLIAPMIHSAQKVQDMLDAAGDKSIPGLGYTGMLPGVMLSKEGNINRAQIKMFANAMLRNQAGLSQTLSETENANLEMLANGKFSEKEFKASWPNLMEKVNTSVNATRAGYNPDVVKTFEDRGGYLSPVKSRIAGTGGLTPAEEAELAARKARAGQ